MSWPAEGTPARKPFWYRPDSNSTILSRVMYLISRESTVRLGVHLMQTFWCQRAVPVALLITGLSMSLPAAATPPTKERLPLTLSGSGCDSKETEMNDRLAGHSRRHRHLLQPCPEPCPRRHYHRHHERSGCHQTRQRCSRLMAMQG